MSRKPKSDALQELYEELIGDDPKKQADSALGRRIELHAVPKEAA